MYLVAGRRRLGVAGARAPELGRVSFRTCREERYKGGRLGRSSYLCSRRRWLGRVLANPVEQDQDGEDL